jgi:rare lipoprotein A
MKYAIKASGAAAFALLVSSCGGIGGAKDSGDPQSAGQMSAPHGQMANPDQPTLLGSPFVVGNTTYTPEDVASYDDVGYAGHYAPEREGQRTANGEVFMSAGVTAAHKTLPMPSYVEVTALDTGRTILVRVNDRGPFANDRLIDLSEGAARQLGIAEQGLAGVRVRKVNPPEQERAVLRDGQPAAARIDTPESLLRVLRDKLTKMPKPGLNSWSGSNITRPVTTMRPIMTKRPIAKVPAVREPVAQAPEPNRDGRFIREGEGHSAPVTRAPANREPAPRAQAEQSDGNYVVQVAAFSTRSRADALARKLGARVVPSADGRLYRVQYGPYANEADAQRGLASARQRGYPQAKLFTQ